MIDEARAALPRYDWRIDGPSVAVVRSVVGVLRDTLVRVTGVGAVYRARVTVGGVLVAQWTGASVGSAATGALGEARRIKAACENLE